MRARIMLSSILLAASLSVPCSDIPALKTVVANVAQYDLERLGFVRMDAKRATVHVETNTDFAQFLLYRDEIMRRVAEFYQKRGVELAIVGPEEFTPRPNEVRIVFGDTDGLDGKHLGGAHYVDRTVYLKLARADEIALTVDARRGVAELWQTTAHELAHLFGLYHADVGTLSQKYRGVENLLWWEDVERSDWWRVTLAPVQVRQLHSYLSRGKVFRAAESMQLSANSRAFGDYTCMVDDAVRLRRSLETTIKSCADDQ